MKRIGLLLTLFTMVVLSCKNNNQLQATTYSAQEDLIRTNFNNFIKASWNAKDMDSLKSIVTEDYTRIQNGIKVVHNQSEMQALMNVYFTGFPDAKMTIDTVVVKDRKLFTHWTLNGTNTGVFSGTPATGKKIELKGCVTASFSKKGKLMQEEVYYNELELLQQLGYTLVPPVLE